jgi:hypothetical protein
LALQGTSDQEDLMIKNKKPLDRMAATSLIQAKLPDVTHSQAQRMVQMADISIIATFTDVTIVKTPKGYTIEFKDDLEETVWMHDRSGDDDYSEREEYDDREPEQ